MIIPKYLKHGDKIGLLSPASKVDPEVVLPAIKLLEEMGFEVVTGDHLFAQHHQFAGTDQERSADLQKMLDQREIKAIICSRGGYGTVRTIQKIDWSKFQKNPKWLIGFSDVTVLHAHLNRLRFASVHGVMPRYFLNNNLPSFSFETLLKAITGELLEYPITPSPFNKKGTAKGELIGGNLSILYSLRGTPYDIDTTDKILFIEDLAEYLYHLDRILMNLKLGGQLSKLKGLIVGGFSEMKDNETPFGKNVEEIVLDIVSEYDFPVVFNFPAGHQPDNFALKMGCTAHLEVTDKSVLFKQ